MNLPETAVAYPRTAERLYSTLPSSQSTGGHHGPECWREFRPVRLVTMAMVVLGLVAVSLSAPNVAAASPGPRSGSAAIAWTACDPPGSGLECARVPVPLDWDKPNGKQIELAVIRHLASRPQERMGSMFVNPGGPGASGVGVVQGLSEMLDNWGGGRFDVVSWDPSGTNDGTPVNCFTSDTARDQFWKGTSIPITRAESKASTQTVDLARRRGEVNGDLLDHISTTTPRLPRSGRTARPRWGLTSNLRGPVLRDDDRPDLHQPVPEAHPGHGARRHRGPGRVHQERGGQGHQPVRLVRCGLRQVPGAVRNRRAGHCALAGHGETVAKRVARVFDTARTSSIPAPDAPTRPVPSTTPT